MVNRKSVIDVTSFDRSLLTIYHLPFTIYYLPFTDLYAPIDQFTTTAMFALGCPNVPVPLSNILHWKL
jgi:hypothetical protein